MSVEQSPNRPTYRGEPLDPADCPQDPLVLFRQWYTRRLNEPGVVEPSAVVLSTVNAHGQPSARTLLLRHFDENGFVIYTNHSSRKGRDLAQNPHAHLLFVWPEYPQQIALSGMMVQQSAEESDYYFAQRPREHQLSAWASPQSSVLSSADELGVLVAEMNRRFPADQPVPRPPFWGGYVLQPTVYEFWQGQPFRRHDRVRYIQNQVGEGAPSWTRERLAP